MSQSLGMVPSASSRVGAVGKARLSVGAWLLVGLPLTAVAVLLRLARALCEISSDGVWTAWPGVEWPTVLSVLAMITMTVANVAALREVNLKRLVAWWSVAHLGYLGMALSVLRDRTVDAVLFDAVIYAAMVPGALLMLAPLVEQRGGAAVEVLRGIARETGGSRRVAIVVALFLLSLSGVPPLAGYEARAGLMKAVFESDRWVLMAVATINSGLGLLCCTRLLLLMVDAPREQQHPLSLDGDTGLLAGLLVAVIVGAGLWPATLHLFVQRSAMFFTG